MWGSGGVVCTQATGGGVSKLEGDTPEGGSASLRPQTGRLVSHSGPTCSVPQSLSACQAAAAAWWSCSCGLSAGRYWLLRKQNFEERKKKKIPVKLRYYMYISMNHY